MKKKRQKKIQQKNASSQHNRALSVSSLPVQPLEHETQPSYLVLHGKIFHHTRHTHTEGELAERKDVEKICFSLSGTLSRISFFTKKEENRLFFRCTISAKTSGNNVVFITFRTQTKKRERLFSTKTKTTTTKQKPKKEQKQAPTSPHGDKKRRKKQNKNRTVFVIIVIAAPFKPCHVL